MRGRLDICREDVLEKTLPEDVWWVADNAEYGKFKDLTDVERKGRLYRCVSACKAYIMIQDSAHAIFIRRKALRKNVRRYAKHNALHRLRYHGHGRGLLAYLFGNGGVLG